MTSLRNSNASHKEEEENASQNNHNDPHNDDDDNDDDDDDDDEMSPADYLWKGNVWKQHLGALVVALVLGACFHYHVYDFPTTKPSSRKAHHHPHTSRYRRTAHLRFCPTTSSSSSRTTERETVQAVIDGDDAADADAVDVRLQVLHFFVPSHLVETVGQFYAADDAARNHVSFVPTTTMTQNENEEEEVKNPEYKCLQRQAAGGLSRAAVVLSGRSVAYVEPPVDSFYTPEAREELLRGTQRGGGGGGSPRLSPVALLSTSFAAKVYNWSPEPIRLYWDGGAKAGIHSRGIIQPMHALGTTTSPGHSFHVTPLYDADHVLKRWVLTADEAVVAYDPLAAGNHDKDDEEARRFRIQQALTPPLWGLYQAHQLNQAYGRDYLIHTGRTWLASFPRPLPSLPMWQAHHFGQVQHVTSNQRHFVHPVPQHVWQSHNHDDDNNDETLVALPDYRTPSTSLTLTLTVVSCAPQVWEISHFLSAVEGIHLQDLAQASSSPRGVVFPDDNHHGDTAWIYRHASPIVHAIHHRVAHALQLDETLMQHGFDPSEASEASFAQNNDKDDKDDEEEEEEEELEAKRHSLAEPLQMIKLGQDQDQQQQHPRHDIVYPPMTHRFQPMRFATVFFCLSFRGQVVFPRATNAQHANGIVVDCAAPGKILLWYNVLPDANVDDLAQFVVQSTPSSLLSSSSSTTTTTHNKEQEEWMGLLYLWDPVIH